jgi:hypothetical protein
VEKRRALLIGEDRKSHHGFPCHSLAYLPQHLRTGGGEL